MAEYTGTEVEHRIISKSSGLIHASTGGSRANCNRGIVGWWTTLRDGEDSELFHESGAYCPKCRETLEQMDREGRR